MGPFGDPGRLLGTLQAKLAEIKEEAAQVRAEGAAGGGMVRAVVNGRMEVVSIHIEPSLVSGDDRAMLEDLVVAAVNDGIRKAQEAMTEKMKSLAGGLPLPSIPGFNL